MNVGNLVYIKRASIGVPQGTIGLILETHKPPGTSEEAIHLLHLIATDTKNHKRRYLSRDLEVLNE
jgi:hypothetical protein